MAVFVIIGTGTPEQVQQLADSVASKFKERFYHVAPGQYLVSADRVTAAQVADRLGAPEGQIGRIAVFRVTTYGGWHAKDMWEWITAQAEPPPPSPAPPSPTEPTNE
jgi:hypothetical protein